MSPVPSPRKVAASAAEPAQQRPNRAERALRDMKMSIPVEELVKFAIAYADQTERDHATLVKAVRAGRVEALVEEQE